MKKIITLTLTALIVLTCQAQLAVDSLGRINIHNPNSKPAYVNIEGNDINLRALRTGTAYVQSPAMEAQNQMHGNAWIYGFKGLSYGSGNSSNCGVFGLSTEGGSYKNFGVMGCLHSTGSKGAGIYGTIRWVENPVTAFSKSYAGYFDGDVHIQGNVTYSGSLTGNVMLTSQPDVSTLSSATSTLENRIQEPLASDLLQGISVKTYYHTIPQQDESKSHQQMDYSGLDSIEIAILQNIPEETTEDVIGKQILSKKHYALDTEELEEAFPDLVYENEDGTKSINYIEMVPLLVQSIKELSAKVEALEAERDNPKAIKAKSAQMDIADNVNLSIPDKAQKIQLNIYDLSGKQVRATDVNESGDVRLSVYTKGLPTGTYAYSLIVDGKKKKARKIMVK